jgi:hypothetical protein
VTFSDHSFNENFGLFMFRMRNRQYVLARATASVEACPQSRVQFVVVKHNDYSRASFGLTPKAFHGTLCFEKRLEGVLVLCQQRVQVVHENHLNRAFCVGSEARVYGNVSLF